MLDDILGPEAEEFNASWDSVKPAPGNGDLPAGKYKALVADGFPDESKRKRTACYRIVFEVLEPREFAGRRIYHDVWLTPKNRDYAKRDLAKIRVCNRSDLDKSPPLGQIALLSYAIEQFDDGRSFGKVTNFEVIRNGQDQKVSEILGDVSDDLPSNSEDIPF
jgi:hypothetical protein